MGFKPAHAAWAACLLGASAAAFGADEPGISLREAIERARAERPELSGFLFEARIQDSVTQKAGLRPAPSVELLVEDALGSGSRSSFDAAQTTLSLSRLLELGGKREKRQAVAGAQAERLRSEQAVRQLDIVAGIARAFVEVLAQQARVATAEETVALARRVEAAVDARVRAAASPPAERGRAAVARIEAELALEDAEHVSATTRFALASAIGLREPDFTRVSGDLFAQEKAPEFATLMARLETSADLQRYATEARLRQAELRLAQSRRHSDLQAIVGLRSYAQGDDAALIGGVSLPLFSDSRAQPDIAAAEAGKSLVESQRDAALLKARAQLFAHYQEMEHARHVVEVTDRQLIPELERTLAQTERGWRQSRYSFLEWSDVQRRLLAARLLRIDAAASFQFNRIEIERLTGESLVETGASPGVSP